MLKAKIRKIFDSFDVNKDCDDYEKSLKTINDKKPSYRESAFHNIPSHPINENRRANVTEEIRLEAVLVNAPKTVQVPNHE